MIDEKTWQSLMEIIGSNDGLLAELIDIFLLSSPATLGRLQAAVAQKDRKRVIFEAHALKNASQALGLLSLFERCKELEAEARQGDLNLAERRIDEISREYDLCSKALGIAKESLKAG